MVCIIIFQGTYFVPLFCLFCFVSRPSQQLWSWWDSQFTLPLFSWASLNKPLISSLWSYFYLNWQQPFLNDSEVREKNDRRSYFMINLHESMGPGQDRALYHDILPDCYISKNFYELITDFLDSCFCLLFVALRPKSTAMVIAGRSVHLTTLFPGQAWTSS